MAICFKLRTMDKLQAIDPTERVDGRTSITIICGRDFGHAGECDVGSPCQKNFGCVRGAMHPGPCMVPRGR